MTQLLRVLLIEDNPNDRILIIRELRREFLQLQIQEIINSEDFDQAIANADFDAVVTDYQLRWSHGLTVLQTIKARLEQLDVLNS